MSDPVILDPCKHTFDRESIICLENNKCPLCGFRIMNKNNLQSNMIVRNIITKITK